MLCAVRARCTEWSAAGVRACERSAQRSAAVSRQHGLGWFWKGAHRNAGSERNVFTRA